MNKFSKILKTIFFYTKKIFKITTYRYVLVLTDETGENVEILSEITINEIPKKIRFKNNFYNVIGSLHDLNDINNIIIYIYVIKI